MKKTVLIIEDDLDIQAYYEIVLSDFKLNLLKAYNGKEALSIIDSGEKPDLIILDIIMPVMGGEDFLHELRLVRKSTIPIILSSADNISASKLTATYKIEGFFYKLGNLEDLIAVISKNLS